MALGTKKSGAYGKDFLGGSTVAEITLLNVVYVKKAQKAFVFVNQRVEKKEEFPVIGDAEVRELLHIGPDDRIHKATHYGSTQYRTTQFRIKFLTPEDALAFTLHNHKLLTPNRGGKW